MDGSEIYMLLGWMAWRKLIVPPGHTVEGVRSWAHLTGALVLAQIKAMPPVAAEPPEVY